MRKKPSSGPAVLFSLVSSEFVIGLFSPQGLGLLINLVEYSSRNRHCLVDMEYTVDNVCLEDAALQPSDPQPSDAAAEPAPEGAAETEAEQTVTTGALAALVKVGVVPGDVLASSCFFFFFVQFILQIQTSRVSSRGRLVPMVPPSPTDADTVLSVPVFLQLFLERERAAILAEAKTDDLISEAPKPALDQSGEWQETSGEIQWVASETNESQPEKKEEEDEELDLNKGRCWSGL